MFGLVSRTCRKRLFALALLAASGTACREEKQPNELGFRVRFACEADRTQSDLLRLRVLPDGCGADNAEPLYEAALARGEQAPAANAIGPGTYGVEAAAFAQDTLIARGCSDVQLPRADAIELVLRSDTCTEVEPLDAAVEMDAASDAGSVELDAEAEDAEPEVDAEETDAPPRTCTSDCADSDPCTDDLCVDGECTNPAFSGARECDDIACTQGDMCVEGECRPGAPNDAACDDDGNACTAETCVAGAGCNRSNAGANGRSCDDSISCTSSDTCSNGICSGMDTCVDSVCSAAKRVCVTCTDAEDCDDRNPCTNDVCGGDGKCTHTNNSAPCNDGKTCTNNDICAGGSCAGTSNCPSDATCGGSTCSCNDGNETLCNNSCVDVTNTTSHCGFCGRACTGGSCQNSACKPSGATSCTAHRSGGHDYLVCTDTLSWAAARDRCRSYGLVLVIIDSQGENDFLQANLGSGPRWIGANDRTDPGRSEGNNCRLSGEEGTWHWANTSSDEGVQLCAFASAGSSTCAATSDRYVNWSNGEPNNAGCNCNQFGCFISEGQDCASIDPSGTWDDDQCSATIGYICETP